MVGALLGTGCELLSGEKADNGPQVLRVTVSTHYTNGNIVSDLGGNLYYPDVNKGVIERVTPDGEITEFVDYRDAGGYATIAIDSNDILYLAHNWTLSKVTPNGTISDFVSFPYATKARLMKVDANGNIYYTDTDVSYVSKNRIMKVAPSGAISVFAGSGLPGNNDGHGISASFSNPQDVAIDSSGNVYVSDADSCLIRKITPAGDVSTFAGSGNQLVQDGVGTSASFFFYSGGETGGGSIPAYLSFDSSGNLYVGDEADGTGYIRKITPDGVVSTYCGNGSTVNIDVNGSCDETGVWINGGLVAGPGDSLYFATGTSIHKVSD